MLLGAFAVCQLLNAFSVKCPVSPGRGMNTEKQKLKKAFLKSFKMILENLGHPEVVSNQNIVVFLQPIL